MSPHASADLLMQWVVKPTKLCNLRCNYCYEWDHLSDPARMSEEVWKHTLLAIREYSELATEQHGFPVSSDIIWHGGEPLTLPTSYFANVMNLQSDIFPRDWIKTGRVRNCLQTNLYSAGEDMLDLLKQHDFHVGVSLDFCRGVRLTAAGQETEDKVRENIRRLEAKDIYYNLITVLAGHTCSNVEYVFKELSNLKSDVRLLPLFGGPPTRPMNGIDISHTDAVNAMFKLFKLWFEAGMMFSIIPLDECFTTVVMKKLNLQRPRLDRTRLANEVFVIDRNGSLSCAAFRDSRIIANVAHMRISEIIRSAEYRSLVDEEAQLKETVCSECSFFGACDTGPLAQNLDSHAAADCPIDRYLCPLIERYLEEYDFFDKDFLECARSGEEVYIEEMRHWS